MRDSFAHDALPDNTEIDLVTLREPRGRADARRPATGAATRAAAAAAASALLVSLSACISGRVLEGYPGYPFLSFTVPAVPDSAFFALQNALQAEGFELDYSEREAGTINTRPLERPGGRLFLTVVVDTAGGGAPGAVSSRVWVAGYEPLRDGSRRIDPLNESAWADLREIAGRLSDRLGGGPPEEPEPPAGRRADVPDAIRDRRIGTPRSVH